MTRRLAQRARRILTVSHFSAGELWHHLGAIPERVSILPPGCEHVGDIVSDPSVLDRHGLRGRPFLMAVGSHSPHKNFGALVRAAERLTDPSFLFVIAGGANPRVHTSVPGSGPLANLCHVGAVSDAELRALYEAATGYIHPAYYEGFGLPPLEAMALGCPVLTSRAASLTEVCGEAAWYFDPFDDADIVHSIRRFATDSGGRARLKQSGLERAAAFSWNGTARGVLTAAQEALA